MPRGAAKPEPEAAPEPVPVHYVGDGGTYVIGISIDPTVTSWIEPERLPSLLETGLFAEGPAPEAPAPADPVQVPAVPAEGER